jgi:IclR family mhp operon transcriptional activator
MDTRSSAPVIDAPDQSSSGGGNLRPIRSLLRGLKCLTVLNTKDGVTVTEIAQAAKLPRTTAHRILETLCEGGYVVRDAADDRYRATIQVRALSDGFGDQSWVREIARPALSALCAKVIYPVAIATPSGLTMLVRDTTDRESPLALERFSAGVRMPLLTSAAGRLYLSLCPANHRRSLLDVLQRTGDGLSAGGLRDRAGFERELTDIQTRGFALFHRMPQPEATVAVPIYAQQSLTAILQMRFIASALTPKEIAATYVPQLRETADSIGIALTDRPSPPLRGL